MTKYNNVILGSGITGVLARHLLGDDWTIIPFGRSRFYSFQPALADNYIIRDSDGKIDHVIEHLGGKPMLIYRIRYDVQGEIMPHGILICDTWLDKVFRGDPPAHAAAFMKSRQDFMVYDLRVNKLYIDLQKRYKSEIAEQNKLGDVQSVGKNHFVRNGEKIEFNRCINTIPLNVLLNLCNANGLQLEADPVWIYHIQTDELDFEGCNQLFVVDPGIAFYKVVRIAPNRYMFYCNMETPQPGPYFMAFINRFDILDGTMIPNAIPRGDMPKIDVIEDLGIKCIGSYARWDWCEDVGTGIMRILEYKKSLVTQ